MRSEFRELTIIDLEYINFKKVDILMRIKKIYIFLIICGFISNCNKSNKYSGGWPVNSNSDNIQDPGYNLPCPGATGCECTSNEDCDNQNCSAHPKGNFCVPKEGDIIPRFNAIDQFGENVDLYDFANQGKMILIELSAAWCSPCNDVASWLTTGNLKIRENPWWNDRYIPIRDMIENGEILLVNYLFEGTERKTTVTPDDVAVWYSKYPDSRIPVLADENRFIHSWVKPTGLPCIFLVDENMRLINYTNRGLTDAFLYLTEPKK